jgi:hypothetical protein
MKTLEQLRDEMEAKYGKDSKMVKQLDRQIAANRSGQTSQDLYVTGSYKRPTQTV